MRWIPLVVWFVDVLKVNMMSGMAWEQGSRMPRLPAFKLSYVMIRAWWGRIVMLPMRSERKLAMLWLVVEKTVAGSFMC